MMFGHILQQSIFFQKLFGVYIYVFAKSSVLEVKFQTLGISLRLSIAVAKVTAAVFPMN